jgi:hypothetical protein
MRVARLVRRRRFRYPFGLSRYVAGFPIWHDCNDPGQFSDRQTGEPATAADLC